MSELNLTIAQSPDFLESIASDPAVFGAISMRGQEPPLLLGSIWNSCIGLEFDDGGWLVQRIDLTLWECHTLFLPGSTDVRKKAELALRHMFTATECLEIATKVPRDIPAALGLAKAMGFKHRYTREKAWPREGVDVDVDYLSMRMEDWIVGDAFLRAAGEAFHDALKAAGLHSDHPEDPVHDEYVGMVATCARAGQTEKAVWLYNRWAAVSGYRMVSTDGARIYFDDVVASLDNGEFKLEKTRCQSEH